MDGQIKNEQIYHSEKTENVTESTTSNAIKEIDAFSSRELIEIAKNQKNIIWLVIIGLVLPSLNPYLILISSIVQAIFIYNLAVSMKSKSAQVYCFLMFIPLINLIVLLIVSGEATSILNKNGVKVGLMGAQIQDISQLEQEIQIDNRISTSNNLSSSDNFGNLEKLAELRDKSIITEEEFQEKKRQILDLQSLRFKINKTIIFWQDEQVY